jgi:hypothetical protein
MNRAPPFNIVDQVACYSSLSRTIRVHGFIVRSVDVFTIDDGKPLLVLGNGSGQQRLGLCLVIVLFPPTARQTANRASGYNWYSEKGSAPRSAARVAQDGLAGVHIQVGPPQRLQHSSLVRRVIIRGNELPWKGGGITRVLTPNQLEAGHLRFSLTMLLLHRIA